MDGLIEIDPPCAVNSIYANPKMDKKEGWFHHTVSYKNSRHLKRRDDIMQYAAFIVWC